MSTIRAVQYPFVRRATLNFALVLTSLALMGLVLYGLYTQPWDLPFILFLFGWSIGVWIVSIVLTIDVVILKRVRSMQERFGMTIAHDKPAEESNEGA